MGEIATVVFIAALIGFVYSFFYIIKPTVGMSEEYKAQKSRGNRIALVYMFVVFVIIGTICMEIIKAVY